MTLDERVAFLEGRVEEQTRQTEGIREAMGHLEHRVDRRFEAMDVRLQTFEDRVDRRFEGIDRRLEGLERRLVTIAGEKVSEVEASIDIEDIAVLKRGKKNAVVILKD